MLKLAGLTVHYGGNPRPAAEGVHLTVSPGESVCLVGESGSGKTTVLRTILGLLPGDGRVTAGSVRFQDRDLLAASPRELRRLRGTEISSIFQDAGAMLNPVRNIGGQYLEYIRAHRSLSRREAKALGLDMLARMRLPHGETIWNSYPFQLSGGQRQRVGIAMAMTFHPRLLLADEPTSALDVTTQAQIVRQMMALREEAGTGILLVTHNLGVAAYMADRILVMKAGRVVDAGTREDILHRPRDPYTRALLEAVPTLGGKRFV